MLGFIAGVGSLEHPDEFRHAVLPGLRNLVPCDIVTFNELRFEDGRMVAAVSTEDPPGAVFPGAAEVFRRLGAENPLLTRHQRTRDGRPYKWSDFITRRELHATELYREAYARMGVEYQMAFALPAPLDLVLAYALNRGRRDFTERDRGLLNLVRGPLVQAYRAVHRYATLAQQMAALERGLELKGTGIAILERGRTGLRIGFASAEAARALGLDAGSGRGLPPGPLRDWLSAAGRRSPAAAPLPPLLLEAPGRRTIVHYLAARRPGDGDALLVESTGGALAVDTLRGAGLTPREAEILQLVALGHSNAAIAEQLVLSPRTVQKHLEHVYEKVGVSSRTQAVLTAWSITPGTA